MTAKQRGSTIAALLDRTSWDYTPGTDGSILLASVGRMFASVAWDFLPQHLGIDPKSANKKSRKRVDDVETRPCRPVAPPKDLESK